MTLLPTIPNLDRCRKCRDELSFFNKTVAHQRATPMLCGKCQLEQNMSERANPKGHAKQTPPTVMHQGRSPDPAA